MNADDDPPLNSLNILAQLACPNLLCRGSCFCLSYELVLTHIYNNDTQVEDSEMPIPGSWFPVEGTEFLFFDGTTDPPMPLKTTADWNYLSQSIHILGLFLMSLAMFIAIASGLWVFFHRENRIVKASQPEFLYLLCFGSAMVAFSLFFISWDEDKGISEDALSSFCSVFPWLFVIGYQVMYLALFFKVSAPSYPFSICLFCNPPVNVIKSSYCYLPISVI